MNKLPKMIAVVVALFMVLEACCFFWVAYWMAAQYRTAHATWGQALNAGSGDWAIGLLLVAIAAIYATSRAIRPWLRILAIVAGIYGFYSFLQVRSFVQSWNIFHGDLIAISALSSVGLLVIGVLAAIDHYANKPKVVRAI